LSRCPNAFSSRIWDKSTKASLRFLKTTPLYSLSNTEVIEKGCDSLMYTFESRFVFRKISTVSISRSAPKMNNQIVVPRRHGAVRFLFWWLFLHRRLRPRQRGSTSCDMSGVAPVWLIISKGRYSFLSEQLSKMSFDIFKQAFRLRFRTFETVAFRSCRLRTHASPHMFHLPVPVKMPVSNLDCDAILHP